MMAYSVRATRLLQHRVAKSTLHRVRSGLRSPEEASRRACDDTDPRQGQEAAASARGT